MADCQVYATPKINIAPENDDWKTIPSLLGGWLFGGELLNFEGV